MTCKFPSPSVTTLPAPSHGVFPSRNLTPFYWQGSLYLVSASLKVGIILNSTVSFYHSFLTDNLLSHEQKAILVMRTYAIYACNKKLLVFLLVLYTVSNSTCYTPLLLLSVLGQNIIQILISAAIPITAIFLRSLQCESAVCYGYSILSLLYILLRLHCSHLVNQSANLPLVPSLDVIPQKAPLSSSSSLFCSSYSR